MISSRSVQRPACLGGPKSIPAGNKDANRWPIITEEEIVAVTDILQSGELSLHKVTRDLEQDYRNWLGVKHAIACCNGTAAILAALHSFKFQPGDEVLVPSATYWASVLPLLWCGAVPIFCETEPEQLSLDPVDVEQKITPRTKAMIVVHLWGMPSKMDELLAIARRHNLKVFEDASHSHGAVYKGRLTGTLGDAAVFSLQTNKLAPAGEGGILVTNDDEIAEHATCLGHFERILDLPTPSRRFAGTGFGLKHRMSPLSAAIARAQLRHLHARNEQRNHNIEYLSRKLEEMGLRTFLPPRDVRRVYFLFIIQNEESRTGLPTDLLVRALQAEGGEVVRPKYPLLHQQPVFTEDKFIEIARLQHLPREQLPVYRPDDLPRTTLANAALIQMPAFPSAQRSLLDAYALAFEKVLSHAAEIRRGLAA